MALIIFSAWNPLRAVFAAYLFGALKGVGFKFQGVELGFPGFRLVASPQILDMLPYLATILVLVFITRKKQRKHQSPAALGQPFFREEA